MCGPIIINDMSNLRESVKARLKEEQISFLLVQFVDLSGAAKVKMCPVEALDALVAREPVSRAPPLEGLLRDRTLPI